MEPRSPSKPCGTICSPTTAAGKDGNAPVKVKDYNGGRATGVTGSRQCLVDAGTADIREGESKFHKNTAGVFASTQYCDMNKSAALYRRVRKRANIPCDWPYAARRYNGSGINSYHPRRAS
jgi:hypothetical protein